MATPGMPPPQLDPSVLAGMGIGQPDSAFGAPAPVDAAPFSPSPDLAPVQPSAPVPMPMQQPGAPSGLPPGVDPSLAGAPGAPPPASSLLPAPVMQAVQSGFAPGPPTTPGPVLTADQAMGTAAKNDKKIDATNAYNATPEGKLAAASNASAAEFGKQADMAQQKSQLDAAQADAEAKAAQQKADAQVQFNADQAKRIAAQQTEIDARTADKIKAADAASKAIVDPSRAWKDTSTPGKIISVAAVMLSGLGQGLNHGQGTNLALDQINGAIKADIDSQKSNMEQKNKVVDQKGDLLNDSIKSATRQNADAAEEFANKQIAAGDQLLAYTAKFKGPGQQLAGQQLASQLKQQGYDKLGQLATSEVATKQHLADQANEITKANIGAAAGVMEAKLHAKEFDWTKSKDQQELAIKLMGEQTKEQAVKNKQITPEQNKLAIAAPVEGSNGQHQILFNKDGTPWQAEGPDQSAKMGDLVANTTRYHNLVEQIQNNIKEHGGEADFLKSDTWQQQKSKLAEAQQELAEAYGIKRISDTSKDYFDKISTANIDPTSFVRDATAALKSSDTDLVSRLNDKLRAHKYDGPPVELPSITNLPKPIDSESDVAFKGTLKQPGLGDQIMHGGLSYGTKQTITNIAGVAGSTSSTEQQRAAAVKQLTSIVDNAQSEGAKQYASQQLQQLAYVRQGNAPDYQPAPAGSPQPSGLPPEVQNYIAKR